MARKSSATTRRKAPSRTPQAMAAAVENRHVVYVHGICAHAAGYSDPWWAAMHPFTAAIPDANHHEVLWSDVITPAQASLMPMHSPERLAMQLTAPALPADPQQAALAENIRDVLTDRLQREQIQAAVRPASSERGMGLDGTAPAHAFLLTSPIAPLPFLGLPDAGCVNDFVKYLTDSALRDQVIERFNQVVRPLLSNGVVLEVISHSWGTVVAYEALRRMDADATLPDHAVLNLFTVGAALAIAPVKRRLLPEASDGQRPRVVRTWINLNAHFDIVGGPLNGHPFQVDAEFLNLPPVGCSSIIPNPVCAHSSYFQAANVLVNRDIFGKYIAS